MAYGQPFYTYPTAGYTTPAPNYNFYGAQPQAPSMAPNTPVNGFQQQGQVNTQQATQIPTKTNVPLVTSLTEAMGRATELNSDTFYADQDKPFIYRVSVDMQGRKTYKTFEIKDVTEQVVEQSAPTNVEFATKDDLKALREEILGYAQSFGFTANATTNATPTSSKSKKPVAKVENEDTVKE